MSRKRLIELLLDTPMTLYAIAKLLEADKKAIEDDLRHLARTLKRSGCRIIVQPARCHKCGFIFSAEHLRKPGKCPLCKGTWIAEPTVAVISRKT
jgi:predicted Zn-ribbon and HTH transcriptional regulator